ncbi:hypothetical protein [Shewanella violacea]|uniref:Uncharacterized protein n=1 Tax=Shewanella violacea (strain JCM 10179 / CIP 106290 / LMG 19151 / DSS12) TaxID=637905 RepID=D4ZD31_SHEVD|nr:hypothetical protein [Shewanella violacea]BAJ03926.1 hypothetical protein SVI_3955 [Shewanella violacea DSS12]
MNIANLSGKNFSLRLRSILVCIAILLTGCSSLSAPISNSSQVLHVSVTELSQYWIVKGGALDWSILFPEQTVTSDFTANLVINSQGKIQLIDLTQQSGSFKIDEHKLDVFSRQSFIPTKNNHTNQAVSVTVEIIQNQ